MSEINIGKYILPLSVGSKNDLRSRRFIGSCWLINERGWIVTCSHLFDYIEKDDLLFAEDLINNRKYPFREIKKHPNLDFGFGKLDISFKTEFLPISNNLIVPGIDIFTVGFTVREKLPNKQTIINSYLFKGYISRVSFDSVEDKALSTCEVSFPSMKGFSGSPIIIDNGTKLQVIGMLYDNHQMETILHEEENGTKTKRIFEFGMAHTALDIKKMMFQMGKEDLLR